MSSPVPVSTMSSTVSQTTANDTKTQNSHDDTVADSQFGLVVGFSDTTTQLWAGTGDDCLAIDTSGSISGKNELLERVAVAALLKDTPAEGQFVIPEPSGATALIQAVEHCREKKKGTLFIISDGGENRFAGNLAVGTEDDGSTKVIDIDFRSAPSAALLADHLQYIGAKVCVLGIGSAALPMVTEMLGRERVFCAHVSTNNIKEIVATTRYLKSVSMGKAGTSVTRNGVQNVLLVSLNKDIQQSMALLTPAEMDQLDDTIGRFPIKNGHIVCPADLKQAIDELFVNYDENITGHESDLKAALLLALEAMCDGPMPAAIVSSKHTAIIGVPQGWREFRRHLNRFFSRMASANIVNREPAVAEGGIEVENNGHKHRFSAGCAQYSCNIPVSAVTGLAETETYCTAREDLPAPKIKKRKHACAPRAKKKMRVD